MAGRAGRPNDYCDDQRPSNTGGRREGEQREIIHGGRGRGACREERGGRGRGANREEEYGGRGRGANREEEYGGRGRGANREEEYGGRGRGAYREERGGRGRGANREEEYGGRGRGAYREEHSAYGRESTYGDKSRGGYNSGGSTHSERPRDYGRGTATYGGHDRGGPHHGQDRGAPTYREGPSYSERPHSFSQGTSNYGSREASGGYNRGNPGGYSQGRSDQSRDPQKTDERFRDNAGGDRRDRGPPRGGQGYRAPYELRGHAFGQQQSRYSGARQGGGDDQAKDKNIEEMMAKMAVRREAGKQLSLSGWRGDLTVMPPEEPLHEVVRSGSIGRTVDICTNLFKFEAEKTRFYHYDVKFSPSIESTRLKRKMVKAIEGDLNMTSNYVTDGSNIYTPVLLDERLLKDIKVTCKTCEYTVTIKHVATIEPNSHIVIQILNVVFGSLLQSMGWRWSDGSYYDYSQVLHINNTSVSAYPGFFTSILEYKSGIRLMLDVSHKIITSQNVWDASNCDKRILRNKVIGKIVYTGYNAKTYKIDDVDLSKNVNSTFNYRGANKSIKDYYREKYGVTITDENQPLLVVKPKRRQQRAGAPDVIWLVPELCLVTGIDERDRSNYQFMKRVDDVTKPLPNERARRMTDFVSDIKKDDTFGKMLGAFGITLDNSMEEIKGRELPGVNATQTLSQVTRNKLLSTVPMNNWKIIHPAQQNIEAVHKFVDQLMRCMKVMGMQYSDPQMSTYRDINEMQHKLQETQSDSDMVMVVMRGNNSAEYSSAKKILCVKNPIPSQVVTSRIVENKAIPAICSKVALQMNCKMGGAGWSIRNMNSKDIMIIGVDTYHDSETRGASYMGVVATMDDLCTRYHTTWCKQDPGQEIAVSFRQMLLECFRAYLKQNNNRPCKRIVVYRDGVGDGQLGHLMESEVQDAERAVADMGWKGTGIVFVVVKKRIHSRFFFKSEGKDDKGHHIYDNVKRGIVIDEVATKPGWMDFFLINQEAREGHGTLTPTHFNVVLNSSNMTIDDIQMLTYQQCFMYYNWNDSIRVPATCQYAHKVAFLIGQAVHRSPSDKLKNKLFFL